VGLDAAVVGICGAVEVGAARVDVGIGTVVVALANSVGCVVTVAVAVELAGGKVGGAVVRGATCTVKDPQALNNNTTRNTGSLAALIGPPF
jgi:hypothetical protein